MLSQRFYQRHWRAWLWPAENPSWSHLEPSLTDVQKGSDVFWRHPWCSPAADKILSPKPSRCILLPYMLMLSRFTHLVWVGVSLFFACAAQLCCCQNCCMCPAVKIIFFYFYYMHKLPVSVMQNTSGISSSFRSLLFPNFLQKIRVTLFMYDSQWIDITYTPYCWAIIIHLRQKTTITMTTIIIVIIVTIAIITIVINIILYTCISSSIIP